MGNLPFSSYGGPQFCGPSCISRLYFYELTGDFEDDMHNPVKGIQTGSSTVRVFYEF